ncbi:uncharacterized protein LOC111270679 [Varroa jacobsoni]|uniref:uncharacterized protein LOC111270679 n=1 Tax=Varroa jacobsoni TaxID=62625 RepID=UPI000BF2F183|nr:uncharacterized protein LOC111270679 [Varroa jacobsoni]
MLNVTNDRLSLVKAFEKTRKIELLLTGSFGAAVMAAEIKLNQLVTHLSEIRTTLIENRRFIVVPAAAVLGYVLLRDPIRDGCDRFYSWYYANYCVEIFRKTLGGFRQELKDHLSRQHCQDPQPHNDTRLRILEIGMGSGFNLDCYPKSSRVVGIEPNPYLIDTLLEKQKSHPELVRVIRGYAEDLADIQDESIDAVVSTLVLCSVRDVDKAVQEAKRVLVKGGRLYLFEHVLDSFDFKRRLAQRLLNPFWRFLFDGCEISRDVKTSLLRHEFQMAYGMSSTREALSQLLAYIPKLRSSMVQSRRYVVISIAGLMSYYVLRGYIKDRLDRHFFFLYTETYLEAIDHALLNFRESMKDLMIKQNVRSRQGSEDGELRILEIGMGPGSSLDFFSEDSYVVAVEPNPYFVELLLKKQKKYHNLKRIILGGAEDLSSIDNESIDAVVSTLVLCSVRHLDKTLQEVQRVLVKGGRFYFFEHVADTAYSKRYIFQIVLNPFWRIYYDGCNINRNTKAALLRFGFQLTAVTEGDGFFNYFVNNYIEGYATKL